MTPLGTVVFVTKSIRLFWAIQLGAVRFLFVVEGAELLVYPAVLKASWWQTCVPASKHKLGG